MPLPTVGGDTHNTRASASLALLKNKLEDKTKKQTDSTVQDPISAVNFLIDGNLKTEDDEMTFEFLSAIAMQLSQQRRTPKLASEAFELKFREAQAQLCLLSVQFLCHLEIGEVLVI